MIDELYHYSFIIKLYEFVISVLDQQIGLRLSSRSDRVWNRTRWSSRMVG